MQANVSTTNSPTILVLNRQDQSNIQRELNGTLSDNNLSKKSASRNEKADKQMLGQVLFSIVEMFMDKLSPSTTNANTKNVKKSTNDANTTESPGGPLTMASLNRSITNGVHDFTASIWDEKDADGDGVDDEEDDWGIF